MYRLACIAIILSAFTTYSCGQPKTQNDKIAYLLDVLEWEKSVNTQIEHKKLYYSHLQISPEDRMVIDSVWHTLDSGEVRNRMTKTLAQRFTPGEIDTMYLFFNSPAGRKFRKKEYETYGEMDALFSEEYKILKLIEERTKGTPAAAPANFYKANRPDGIYLVERPLTEEQNSYELGQMPLLKLDVFKDISTIRNTDYSMQLQIEFTPAGAKQFYELSKKYTGRQIAVVADKTIITAPVIQEAMKETKITISGSGNKNEMEAIVQRLKKKMSK
ncbi:MAG: DUF2059 domain-containing protein [Niabella sp.]|nr:DUF2059 domain-containing protein [Niabella sp.]